MSHEIQKLIYLIQFESRSQSESIDFCCVTKMEVSEDVKEFINEIAAKYNWGPVSETRYSPGSEAGDGYGSKHVAVDIVRSSDTLKLFVKYAINLKLNGDFDLTKFYTNEANFYDKIFPTYGKFLREKGLYKGVENVPKSFGSSTKNVIALENVKDKGFVLFDRTKMMNDQHIVLVLKSFARFHAISFAFKDQKKEAYEKLMKECDVDLPSAYTPDAPMVKMSKDFIRDGLSKFDPEKDKRILEKCDVDALAKVMVDIAWTLDEHSIMTKGDCWCNNFMFLYEDGDRENPTDIMHVDWQLAKPSSLAYDLSYFFFTVASPEALSKLDSYLKLYYSELSDRIKRLGSDPKVVYPHSVFEKEWKQYRVYGFAIAFSIFKAMLLAKDEIPNFEEMEFGNVESLMQIQDEDEYHRRIRILAEFFVDNGYI